MCRIWDIFLSSLCMRNSSKKSQVQQFLKKKGLGKEDLHRYRPVDLEVGILISLRVKLTGFEKESLSQYISYLMCKCPWLALTWSKAASYLSHSVASKTSWESRARLISWDKISWLRRIVRKIKYREQKRPAKFLKKSDSEPKILCFSFGRQ